MKIKNTLLALAAMSGLSQAATVTPVLKVNFSGTISGNTYTLGAGELDSTSTFTGNGNPTVSGGLADLAGSVAVDANAQGFKFDPTTINPITTKNWIAETVISFDAFGGGQRTMIDVQGDTDFRINNDGNGLEANFWDGAPGNTNITTGLPTAGNFAHYAMVWNASTNVLTAYINGTSIGSTSGSGAFFTPDTANISFGYLGRSGNVGRGIDGKLDAVAFSTYTGAFDANTDLQLIPEPSSAALLGFAGLALLVRRRR